VNAVIFHANERGGSESKSDSGDNPVANTLRAIDQLQEIAVLNSQLFAEFCEQPDDVPLYVSNEASIQDNLIAVRDKLDALRSSLRVSLL
jgi:hypothetical protein